MEVFEWIRHVLATTTPSIEFESILVVLVKIWLVIGSNGEWHTHTTQSIPDLCIADLAIMCSYIGPVLYCIIELHGIIIALSIQL